MSDQTTRARADVQRVADIARRELSPVWPGLLWCGKLALLCGDPGLGKSLIAIDIAARITRGDFWPCSDQRAPVGDVMMLAAEDDPSDTLRPRLEAAGADIARVHVLNSMLVGGEKRPVWPSLLTHIEALRDAIRERPEMRLLVVDPIAAYMLGTNANQQHDVRGVLGLLAELAADFDACVLAISHLNKASGQAAIYRVTGSLAFVAAARSAFVVARDPRDSDLRVLTCVKNNLAPVSAGYRYAIKENDEGAPFIEWGEHRVMMSADEALSSIMETPRQRALTTGMKEAEDWLRSTLQSGPLLASEVRQLALAHGISDRMLKRAASALGVTTRPTGFQQAWEWILPGLASDSVSDRQCAPLNATVTHLRPGAYPNRVPPT